MDGLFPAVAQDGFEPGVLDLAAAASAVITEGGAALPTSFSADSPSEDLGDLRGRLVATADRVSNADQVIRVGNSDITESLVIEAGADFFGSDILLTARSVDGEIVVEEGAMVTALGNILGVDSRFVEVQPGAQLIANNVIQFDAQDLSIDPTSTIDVLSSAITIGGGRIYILPSGVNPNDLLPDDPAFSEGLFLTEDLWSIFERVEDVVLRSQSDIIFLTDRPFTFFSEQNIAFDAGRVAGITGGSDVTVQAETISFLNLQDSTPSDLNLDGMGGQLILDADTVLLGQGDVVLDSFSKVIMNGRNEVVFRGNGGMKVMSDMDITTSRLTGTFYRSVESEDADYDVLDFSLSLGSQEKAYDLVIRGSGGDSSALVAPGGRMSIFADTISLNSGGENPLRMGVDAGNISLMALNDVFVESGTTLSANGRMAIQQIAGENVFTPVPGGNISLESRFGDINIDEGAIIDVSAIVIEQDIIDILGDPRVVLDDLVAGGDFDAGSISLEAYFGDVNLDGTVRGLSAADFLGALPSGAEVLVQSLGGSIRILSGDGSAMAGDIDRIIQGGFSDSISLRYLGGDSGYAGDSILKANELVLAADSGTLTVAGLMDVSGEEGGRIELHANEIQLTSAAKLDASGEEAGGSVLLNSIEGEIGFASGAQIDVSADEGLGGKVHFRANRFDSDGDSINDDIRVDLQGNINGALDVFVEGVKRYDNIHRISGEFDDIEFLRAQTEAFMDRFQDSYLDTISNLEITNPDTFFRSNQGSTGTRNPQLALGHRR